VPLQGHPLLGDGTADPAKTPAPPGEKPSSVSDNGTSTGDKAYIEQLIQQIYQEASLRGVNHD